MKWRKLGLVFCPDGTDELMNSYATNPFAVPVNDRELRVFFSSRDKQNRSHVFSLDMELDGPQFRTVNVDNHPVISPGAAGLFDDKGVTFVQYLEKNGKGFIFYLGWNIGLNSTFQNSIGLAISDNGLKGPFRKYSNGPIIDKNEVDPFTISYGYVFPFNGKFKMIYGTCDDWRKNVQESIFIFREALSDDLVHWERNGRQVIEMQEGETAVARPCILKDADEYKMWYSFKMEKVSGDYRIGYAVSDDGIRWIRKDNEVGIDISATGWDNSMVSYPHVFDFRRHRYMLYNGNHYGKTGFGLAILEL